MDTKRHAQVWRRVVRDAASILANVAATPGGVTPRGDRGGLDSR